MKNFGKLFFESKVDGPWKAPETNKQFLLVHLLDKWKKQIINEHLFFLCNI